MVVKATYALAVLRNRNMHKKFRSHLQKKPRKVGSVCVSKVKKNCGLKQKKLKKKKKVLRKKKFSVYFFSNNKRKKMNFAKTSYIIFCSHS